MRKLFCIKPKQNILYINGLSIQNNIDYSLKNFNDKDHKYFVYLSQNGNINTNDLDDSKIRRTTQFGDKTIDIIKDETNNFNQLTNSSSIPCLHDTKSKNDYSKTKKKNLEKLLILIKKSLRILETHNYKSKENSLIYDEWKELAYRVDHILFVISAFIVICAPILLFGKFYYRDVDSAIDRNECGCSFK
jgi:hypothetical protein